MRKSMASCKQVISAAFPGRPPSWEQQATRSAGLSAKPADMPVIAADRYDLQINMKTAETLGLTIPQSILSRADALVR